MYAAANLFYHANTCHTEAPRSKGDCSSSNQQADDLAATHPPQAPQTASSCMLPQARTRHTPGDMGTRVVAGREQPAFALLHQCVLGEHGKGIENIDLRGLGYAG